MEIIESMLQLLEQKQRCFEEYEELTCRMLTCPSEELEELLAQRQTMIGRVDRLSEELGAQADSLGEPLCERAKAAMRLSCERDAIPERLLPLFDRTQWICAAANRVSRYEPQLADRIEEELEVLTKRIKENNRSVSARASKYQTAFAGAFFDAQGRAIGKA